MCHCFERMETHDRGACFGNGEHGAQRTHRYLLWVIWDRSKPLIGGVFLNPSTADEKATDSTLTKFVGFAKLWGYGGIVLGNAFAFRSTDPKGLLLNPARSVGMENDDHLVGLTHITGIVMLGWGKNIERERLRFRVRDLKRILSGASLRAWDITLSGQPMHPLYQPGAKESAPYVFPC